MTTVAAAAMLHITIKAPTAHQQQQHDDHHSPLSRSRTYAAGLPAHSCPEGMRRPPWTTAPSATTALASTRAPSITTAPAPMVAPDSIVHDCRTAPAPMVTLSPISVVAATWPSTLFVVLTTARSPMDTAPPDHHHHHQQQKHDHACQSFDDGRAG